MKAPIIIFLSLFLVISFTADAGSHEQTASAKVSHSLALFKAPINLQETYKYYKKSTPDNVLEYNCDISLGRFRFGFSLFKYPGSKEQMGSIEHVLRRGQSTIWLREGDSFSAVKGHGLSIRYSAPFIVMEIVNPLTIQLLFKEHPSICSYKILGFNAPKNYGEIEIQYVE